MRVYPKRILIVVYGSIGDGLVHCRWQVLFEKDFPM